MVMSILLSELCGCDENFFENKIIANRGISNTTNSVLVPAPTLIENSLFNLMPIIPDITISSNTIDYPVQNIKNTIDFIISNDDIKTNLSSSSNSKYLLEQRIYNPIYTFFNYPVDKNIILVDNNQYLKIFKNKIPYEVKYIIDNSNTLNSWDEKILQSLSNEKIILSLDDYVLSAFNNLHYFGNTKIQLVNFINVVRKALISGKLDDIDIFYYINLAKKQSDDKVIQFNIKNNKFTPIEVAVGLASQSNYPADYNNKNNPLEKNDLKRQRRLNTDISARLKVLVNNSTQEIYLRNDGIPVNNVIMPLGEGPGYYIPVVIEGIDYPLECETDIGIANYLPPRLRENVLGISNTPHGITIGVNSLPGSHEFFESFNVSADVSSMYFAINLSSVTNIKTFDPLITNTLANYNLLPAAAAIEHSKTYGLNTTKINIDYCDPIIQYARDSSSLSLVQSDLTYLNSNTDKKSIIGKKILTRTLPFAIILCPGYGTAHNPFGNSSIINDYGNTGISSVQRSITLIHDINYSNKLKTKPFLEDQLTVCSTNGNPYYGLHEKFFSPDPDGIIYQYNPSSEIYNKSYYYNSQYSNVQPPSSNRFESTEANFVLNVLTKLNTYYAPNKLTWWDIFRRLNINQVQKLNIINFKKLMMSLPQHLRNIEISPVLSIDKINSTGITSSQHAEDIIIIYEKDRRKNAQSS